ncbi:hypothetical protein D3C80_1285640 [compost metagenome]
MQPQSAAPRRIVHQQLLHFGAFQAIELLAQPQLHTAQHFLVFADHPQQQLAADQALFHFIEIAVGLLCIEVHQKAHRSAVRYGIQQQRHQAVAVVGKAFSGDTIELRCIHGTSLR